MDSAAPERLERLLQACQAAQRVFEYQPQLLALDPSPIAHEVVDLALEKAMQNIGEEAARIRESYREGMPQSLGQILNEAAGMRNYLVHEYDAVDRGILHDTARVDLGGLIHLLTESLIDPEGL